MVDMNLRALLILGGLGLATFASADAKDTKPKSSNPNVKRAVRKAKKVKATGKYKAPKKTKKPSAAKYGVKHV
jgi:hypothetical protein